jgi:hypothetical protein
MNNRAIISMSMLLWLVPVAPATAAIVYVDIPEDQEGFLHFPLDDPAIQTREFDVNQDGRVDFWFHSTIYTFGVVPSLHVQLLSTGPEGLTALDQGAFIGAAPFGASLWSSDPQGMAFAVNDNGNLTGGTWYGVGERYMGYRLSVDGDYYYGWVRMHAIAHLGALARDYAYDAMPGQGIIAGAIPEPGSATLLTSGLALVLNKRTRNGANKALLPTPRGWFVSMLSVIRKFLGFGHVQPRP